MKVMHVHALAFPLLLFKLSDAAAGRLSLLSRADGDEMPSVQVAYCSAARTRLLQLRGGSNDDEDGDDDDIERVPKQASAAASFSEAAPRESGSFLMRGVKAAVMPPLKVFAQAPPITRSWVSASLLLAVMTSTGVLDTRSICMSEPMVLHAVEWWRVLVNFFFMGDALKSIFFWVQLHHFWDCCKMLEMVKYRWEPADFIKLIVCNAFMLCVLKHHFFPHTIFLGSPMVMTFLYMYAREYEAQQMNLLGFFSIRCGWLPFAQMLQDILQAGDIGPNILGLTSGHIYFYLSEVKSRLLLPDALQLNDIFDLLLKGTPLITVGEPGAEVMGEGDGGGDEGDDDEDCSGDEDGAASAGNSGVEDNPATAAA